MLKLRDLPFSPLLPIKHEMKDLSVRNIPNRRKTVRYLLFSNGKTFRVKEFFMDWFYTGFPKGIMKTLTRLYGSLQVFTDTDIVYYYCRNYKGRDSVSFYFNGTTVEIECYQPAGLSEFKPILEDLDRERFRSERFKRMGFKERSFCANGGNSGWWEDSRIARMEWTDLDRNKTVTIGNADMTAVTSGIMRGSDGSFQKVVIFAEPYFKRVVWVETVDAWSDIERGVYNFRKEDGLFNVFTDGRNSIFHRTPKGPSVIRQGGEKLIVTIAFSPGFQIEEVESADRRVSEILSETESIFTEI